MKQLEDEYLERIAEMRSEMEKAQKAEQRLRADRDEWRLMAENLQATGGKMQLKKVKTMTMETINQLMTHTAVILLPKSTVMTTVRSPPRKTGKGPDRDHPDGGDDPEVTEVKISRREADKVVVPPFPMVTHLDNWMAQCMANVLSACADPNQEEWMRWLSPAFRPHPDIEGLNDSGSQEIQEHRCQAWGCHDSNATCRE